MPPKNFRDSRPDGFQCEALADIKKGMLVRFAGVSDKYYKFPQVVPADADWDGPLYIAQESKRPGSLIFVCRYGYVLNASIIGFTEHGDVVEDTVVYLADGGLLTTEGGRPVGSVASHADKGPIALIDTCACATPTYNVLDLVSAMISEAFRRHEAANAETPEAEVAEAVPEPTPKRRRSRSKE